MRPRRAVPKNHRPALRPRPSYKVPYILPSYVCCKFFVSHSYENWRGVPHFFPIWGPRDRLSSGGRNVEFGFLWGGCLRCRVAVQGRKMTVRPAFKAFGFNALTRRKANVKFGGLRAIGNMRWSVQVQDLRRIKQIHRAKPLDAAEYLVAPLLGMTYS